MLVMLSWICQKTVGSSNVYKHTDHCVCLTTCMLSVYRSMCMSKDLCVVCVQIYVCV